MQLIKAATDAHIWADTFDRKLTDILAVESDVAKAIADQLRVRLAAGNNKSSPPSQRRTQRHMTLISAGWHYAQTGHHSSDDAGAKKYLRESVRLDPKFALGWAIFPTWMR